MLVQSTFEIQLAIVFDLLRHGLLQGWNFSVCDIDTEVVQRTGPQPETARLIVLPSAALVWWLARHTAFLNLIWIPDDCRHLRCMKLFRHCSVSSLMLHLYLYNNDIHAVLTLQFCGITDHSNHWIKNVRNCITFTEMLDRLESVGLV